MQRRTMVGTLLALALAGLILMSASSCMAVVPILGNAATQRNRVADTGSGNAFADINLENKLTAPGFWQITAWNLYVDVNGGPLDYDQCLDLLIWRPQADPMQFELIVRDRVTITAGNGAKRIEAGSQAKAALLQAGDITGFYTPAGAVPVIGFDYYTSAGKGWDPIFDSTTGSASWTVGTIATASDKGYIRQYALNAEIVPVVAPVPEPSSILAMLAGLGGLVLRRKK